MIKQTCWLDSNNVPHLTREECQKAELAILLAEFDEHGKQKEMVLWCDVIGRIIKQSDAILNVLTMKETSLPRARGKAKPRKAKGQSTLPLIPEGGEGKAA